MLTIDTTRTRIARKSHNILATTLRRATEAYHATPKNRRLWIEMCHVRQMERTAFANLQKAAEADLLRRAVNHPAA